MVDLVRVLNNPCYFLYVSYHMERWNDRMPTRLFYLMQQHFTVVWFDALTPHKLEQERAKLDGAQKKGRLLSAGGKELLLGCREKTRRFFCVRCADRRRWMLPFVLPVVEHIRTLGGPKSFARLLPWGCSPCTRFNVIALNTSNIV